MKFTEKAKRFLEPLFHNRFFVIVSIFKFFTWTVYALVGVYIIKYILIATEQKDVILLQKYISFFVVFMCFYFIIAYIIRRADWPYLYHDLQRYLYRKYIPKVITLDNNYLESIGTGKMIDILKTGVTRWVDSGVDLLQFGTKIILMGGVMIWTILTTHLLYGGALILLLLCLQVTIVWLDTYAHTYRKIRTNENSELSRKLVRIIMSRNELIQNSGGKEALDSVMGSIDIIEGANIQLNQMLFFMFNLLRVLTVLIRIFVLLFVGYGVIEGRFSQAEFASILAMIIVFEGFLGDSTEFYKNFTKYFSDIEKLWEILDKGPKMKGYDIGVDFLPKKEDIHINSISYAYNSTKIFSDFSLTLQHGKKTALVGASGGGKTTLMKLIAGYLHPQSGHISVLGNTLDTTALKTYYPHIGYLTQDPGVFDATIRENLISAISTLNDISQSTNISKITSSQSTKQNTSQSTKQNTTSTENTKQNTTPPDIDERINNALRLAHCDFVFELEHGIDTEIGERGVRLSGGQKQRLAIAKIFLKNPEIIVLDEPTSALDSFSEEKITEALDTLFKDKTVIIVAHRLQTVRKADEIIVLEQGQILERGTHQHLIDHGGAYAKMLELQSGF